jgi:phosphoribosylanthranilate isomerase
MTSSPPHSRTRIKICGLTREKDVDAAVQAGVDAIGFVLYPSSPRFVEPERAGDLARRLPSFVTPVLLSVNAPLEEAVRAHGLVPGAVFQFHGDESPEYCRQAAVRCATSYIAVARIPPGAEREFDLVEFARRHASAKGILLDSQIAAFGGGGISFAWSELPRHVNAHLILSGGLSASNVASGIHEVRARGLSLAVDVSSGVEITKGVKDPLKIVQFIKAVRHADALFAASAHASLPTA